MVASGFDWLALMRQHANAERDLFANRLSDSWITAECELALEVLYAQVPMAKRRLEDGDISENLVGYVVCVMVMRVARYRIYQTESNSQYSYTLDNPVRQPTGFDMSPNLYVGSTERAMLEGSSDRSSLVGTIYAGVDPLWG